MMRSLEINLFVGTLVAMVFGRIYWIPSLILWFASMGWLFSSKILPTLTNGQPPTYDDLLPKTEVTVPEPIRWSIRWNGDEIGHAENKITRSSDGTGEIVSEVTFNQLPVDAIVQDVLGVMGGFARPFVGQIGKIDLRVLTCLNFDHYGTLSNFETTVDLAGTNDLLRILGHVHGDLLDLRATVDLGEHTEPIYREQEFRLPPGALLADSFSPRPRLANLRIGQTWTFQSYQPLMPHQPLTLIQATVEHEELLAWNGTMVRTRKVVYRRDAGSGITTTRRPISEIWVRPDGTVIRQDLVLANVKVQFIREAGARQADSGIQSDSSRSTSLIANSRTD